MSAGSLYWLASYPKSGNTWMRILLTNYFSGGGEPADINALDGGPIASARQVFDDNVGIKASDLTQDEIERLRPAVYELVSANHRRYVDAHPEAAIGQAPPILKVHDAWTLTPDGVPLLSVSATAGAIYLLRNPLDVVPSFAHHSGWTLDKTIEKLASEDTSFVSNPRRLDLQLRQRLLTWSNHVRSWTAQPKVPTLVIRYEDMIDDAADQLRKAVQFLGHAPDENRIDVAVEHSRFDKLKAQESQTPFRETSSAAANFFRKGVVGDWQTTLTVEQAERVCRDHGTVMAEFGYLPGS